MATLDEVTQILKVLGAAFPATSISEQTAAVYAVALEDLSAEQLQAATLWLISNHESNWLPAIATIRRAAIEHTGEQLPTVVDAQAEMLDQIHRVGLHGVPQFSHPAIAKAVEAVQWRVLCMSTKPEIVNAQFRKAYETVATRWKSERQSLPADSRAANAFALIANKMKALPKK